MLAQAISSTRPTTARIDGQRLHVALPERTSAGRRRRQRERLLQVSRLLRAGHRRASSPRGSAAAPRAAAPVACSTAVARLQAEHDVQPPGRAAVEDAVLAADQRLGADRDRDVERAADFGAEEAFGQ